MSEDRELYVEVDHSHPLSWRINKTDPPTSLALISPIEPKTLKSTKGIEVSKYKREGSWLQIFDLTDKGHVGNFSIFCKDMIDSTREADPRDGPDIVAAQYQIWKDMFKQVNDPLGKAQIQGLLGEMIFLRDVIIPRYGEDIALRSWVGPFEKKQDFQCPDMWYEVKAVSGGKSTAKITSLDQLDRDDKGRLAVVRMTDTSGTAQLGFTINSLYRSMMEELSTWSRCLFRAALESAGYRCLEEYDEYCFEFQSITEYEVEEGFPRLRRSKVDKGVTEATYEIYLDIIHKFEVG